MKFYEKLILTILLVFSISFVIYADDIQETETTEYQEEIITQDKTINSSEILISVSKQLDEQGNIIQSQTIPATAFKSTREDVINLIQKHITWSSWTWIGHGDYFSVHTIPIMFLDNQYLTITYEKSIFFSNFIKINVEQMGIVTDRGIKDFENQLTAKEYYVNITENGQIELFSIQN